MKEHNLHPCPCCEENTITELGSYEICLICKWEDDPVQSLEPGFSGGANKISLMDAKRKLESKIKE